MVKGSICSAGRFEDQINVLVVPYKTVWQPRTQKSDVSARKVQLKQITVKRK